MSVCACVRTPPPPHPGTPLPAPTHPMRASIAAGRLRPTGALPLRIVVCPECLWEGIPAAWRACVLRPPTCSGTPVSGFVREAQVGCYVSCENYVFLSLSAQYC